MLPQSRGPGSEIRAGMRMQTRCEVSKYIGRQPNDLAAWRRPIAKTCRCISVGRCARLALADLDEPGECRDAEGTTGVLDDCRVAPELSLLDKVRMQAHVLVPVLRTLRTELGKDKEALDLDVSRCRFADFSRALGERELGALLNCEADFDVAAAGKGEVSLDRAQTIMPGAPSCTFRHRFAPR